MDGVNDLRTLITDLRGDMIRQFADAREDMKELRAEISRQFAEVREDMKESRADMNRQFGEVRADMKGSGQKVDRLFLYLDQKNDRQFAWLVGTQVTVLLAVVGALVGAYCR